jgi:hypothetical protein
VLSSRGETTLRLGRRARLRHLLVPLCALALASPAFAGDDDPIKLKSTFDERAERVAREIADRRVELAKKLEKHKLPRSTWEELRLALRISKDHARAREKLGFKRKGSEWTGGEPPPAMPAKPEELPAELAKERDQIAKDAAQKLAALAWRGKAGGLEKDARRVAASALDEEPSNERARGVLGHAKGTTPGEWVSPREQRVRTAFQKALERAGQAPESAKGDEELETTLGLGRLKRLETPHAVILASPGSRADSAAVARSVETAWAAFHYFFFDLRDGFELEGDSRIATGAAPAALPKPRFLLLEGKAEHEKFCDTMVPEGPHRAVAKTCSGSATVFAKRRIFESIFTPDWTTEWASGSTAEFLFVSRFSKDAPRFVIEGVRRWFSGQVSGLANIYSVGAGSTMTKRELRGGSFAQLRRVSRTALVDDSVEDLSFLLPKGMNDLERLDVAIASAFYDWALARDRAAFVKFATEYDPKSTLGPVGQLEKAFGKKLTELDPDFRAWIREEY